MGRALRAWGWWREQEYPLDSTFRERVADLRQRLKARHAERKSWNQAETLADVGELTAQWADGTVKYHPGGYDEGPAEETLEIAPAIATLNRAGFVTSGSQPGVPAEVGYDGNIFWQRAAVDGFTDPDTADRLEDACDEAGLIFINNGPARLRTTWKDAELVTASFVNEGDGALPPESDDSPYYGHTHFGTHLSRHAVKFNFDGYASRALCSAEQVTIIDPVWGRKDFMWDTLTNAIAPPCCPCNERH